MGDTPTSPGKDFALATLSWFSLSNVLAGGRPSLVRYYALTEQIPLNLNSYRGKGSLTAGPSYLYHLC